jgi:hypothetical protein
MPSGTALNVCYFSDLIFGINAPSIIERCSTNMYAFRPDFKCVVRVSAGSDVGSGLLGPEGVAGVSAGRRSAPDWRYGKTEDEATEHFRAAWRHCHELQAGARRSLGF